jgi:hypothetical protein
MSATLAHCEGYRVLAADGLVGEVERPLFPPDGKEPDYLVVRVRRRVWGRVPLSRLGSSSRSTRRAG